MLNTDKTTNDYVRCPNLCTAGQVKHYPDPTRALHTTVQCTYCKGCGTVNKARAKEIEKEL